MQISVVFAGPSTSNGSLQQVSQQSLRPSHPGLTSYPRMHPESGLCINSIHLTTPLWDKLVTTPALILQLCFNPICTQPIPQSLTHDPIKVP